MSAALPHDNFPDLLMQSFGDILDAPIHRMRNPDNSKLDGVITVYSDDTYIPYVFFEMGGKVGEKRNSDLTFQVSLSMSCSWAHASVGYNHIHLDPMSDF